MIPKTTLFAMEQNHLQAYCSRLRNLHWPTQAEVEVARETAAKQLRRTSGKVAVLPLYGVFEQRLSGWGALFGGVSTAEVEQVMRSLIAARDIEAIVLDIDSPGGVSYGCEELSDVIFEMRGRKPIIAVADSMACSAAYWVGSAADQLAVTPGGDVASVGVYAVHEDYSGALEQMGVKVSIINAGKYKAEFADTAPLTDEARQHLQESVDATYAKFIKAVARNRGTSPKDVRESYGQGRVLNADQALAVKAVDRIATLTQVLEKLTGGNDQQAMRAASTQILRLRQEQRKRMVSAHDAPQAI